MSETSSNGSLAVLGPEEDIEGAISYRVDTRSQLDPDVGAVYVDRLATAPRNRPWVVNPTKYRGVGTVLLFAAVRDSYSLGLGGRVWLSCMPNPRSRAFYVQKGFQMICQHEDDMIDYELPAHKAVEWLKTEGCV